MDSPLCCPLPTNLSMLKMRKRAIRGAKAKENEGPLADPVGAGVGVERQAPLAEIDVFDDKNGNILMPSVSKEVLAHLVKIL
jgi:hypothetical protein